MGGVQRMQQYPGVTQPNFPPGGMSGVLRVSPQNQYPLTYHPWKTEPTPNVPVFPYSVPFTPPFASNQFYLHQNPLPPAPTNPPNQSPPSRSSVDVSSQTSPPVLSPPTQSPPTRPLPRTSFEDRPRVESQSGSQPKHFKDISTIADFSVTPYKISYVQNLVRHKSTSSNPGRSPSSSGFDG
eukprot:c10404_g1_i2.p1 GENE.c10404_g1_i2~~c10404_g1_i2.p1  ORF type:complete len:182 (+),score=8.69 c10404_g1_i2:1-546(+)